MTTNITLKIKIGNLLDVTEQRAAYPRNKSRKGARPADVLKQAFSKILPPTQKLAFRFPVSVSRGLKLGHLKRNRPQQFLLHAKCYTVNEIK
jgi:hypothetical protein